MDSLTLWLILLAIIIFFSLGMVAYTSVKKMMKGTYS